MVEQLSPDNERYIDEAIARGAYRNRLELVDRAVELLRRRDELQSQLDEGLEALARGEFVEYGGGTEDRRRFMEDIRRGSQQNRDENSAS